MENIARRESREICAINSTRPLVYPCTNIFHLILQRKKMKAALFCLVLALIVAIEAAPVEEAEAEMKIETRADAEAFLRRYLNIEERKIDPCADCCRGKADLGRAVCCASFGTLC